MHPKACLRHLKIRLGKGNAIIGAQVWVIHGWGSLSAVSEERAEGRTG
jgi:hypothetical protein